MDDNDGVVVNTSEFQTSRSRSLPGRGEYDFLFNVDIVNLLLKKQWGERQKANFLIFVVWSALILGGWVLVAWGRNFYLGPAEISSFVYLF